jgi:hypothetical protein
VVIKSVEFAKMAVVEAAGMKFMKPWLKRAGMKFVQPGMKPAAMEAEKSGVKSAAMEAGDAGVKSAAGEPATLKPAANCEVRPQESRSDN